MKNLKTISTFAIGLLLLIFSTNGNAQTTKPSALILNIESRGLPYDAAQLGNILRAEIESLDMYDVADKYDVAYLVEKNNLNINNCYGKTCLLEISKVIPTDFIITGGAELLGQNITITLRRINVKTQSIEKTAMVEFINLPDEIKLMFKVAVQTMYEKPKDAELVTKLTKPFNYENTLNNPNQNRINLQGPRFGFITALGPDRNILMDKKINGGFEVSPIFFQLGYQFEKQYLNEGNLQALFEVIPMVSGLEQSLFIPNVAFLNGFRNSKNGWEFAFGPTVSLTRQMEGAVVNGKFLPSSDPLTNGMSIVNRMDSRGDPKLSGALVLAMGKTIKSGRLNIPINVWCLFPSKDGISRIGISFGYNTKL